MKIKEIAAASVTVELSISDCITLYAACDHALDYADAHLPYELVQAVSAALVGSAFAAFVMDSSGEPPTLHAMWKMWAPITTYYASPQQLPLPRSLGGPMVQESE